MEKNIKIRREELLLELVGWINITVKLEHIDEFVAKAKQMSDEELAQKIYMHSVRVYLADRANAISQLSIGAVELN